MLIQAVDKPDLPPFEMPERFRTEIPFFITPSGEKGAPPLQADEYWIRLEDARRWYDDLVIEIVSPLDAASKTEIELTEEQEAWLEWMIANEIERVRVE
jgi:hypothetical protein